MTIFARRSIQRMLDKLAGTLSPHQLDQLIGKLNQNDLHSLATEWEVLVLFGLTHLGRVCHEAEQHGSSRPDISFQLEDESAAQFIADITCVSDRGLEDENPITELMELIRQRAQKLGPRSGAFDHRVAHEITGRAGKRKVSLKMPERKRLHEFFHTRIAPRLKAIAKAPDEPWSLALRDEPHDIEISYRPGNPYSTASYPAFRHATIVDRNPLYNSLEAKRRQLRDTGYPGLKGIIVCDAGCETLTSKSASWDSFSKIQILREFFRRQTSISFVVLIWIESPLGGPSQVRGHLAVNPVAETALPERLRDVLRRIPDRWPLPVQNGENARLELEASAYKKAQSFWGHSFLGGHHMGLGANSLTFQMSARTLVEILAGQMSHADFAAAHSFAAPGQSIGQANPLERAIAQGFTIDAVTLHQVANKDDDWIEFRLAGPDPAISRFTTPKASGGPVPD